MRRGGGGPPSSAKCGGRPCACSGGGGGCEPSSSPGARSPPSCAAVSPQEDKAMQSPLWAPEHSESRRPTVITRLAGTAALESPSPVVHERQRDRRGDSGSAAEPSSPLEALAATTTKAATPRDMALASRTSAAGPVGTHRPEVDSAAEV
eukprot:CAMPEP_0171206588 /NCGR_PEP_ID=MMETSP0790-20130122/27140_1 /TAXON_ID=2925 /ORGANISM="Alexandrium catenella, Strain OF101" /LENGTH=149 /DNA_ID=CAMNT_0011672137 /DNA_START=36 /DNA_END=483 /DNA_ORIENTATION=-